MFAEVKFLEKAEADVKRFPRGYQRRLRRLVDGNPRLADLLSSFPAVAFALVSGFGDAGIRGRTAKLVKSGASLRDVGQELGIPMWMRRLPPEAFCEALGVLPDDEKFSRQVIQFVPSEVDVCAVWLRWVLSGYRGCDNRFALWLASQRTFRWRSAEDRVPVSAMAAYAWFSSRSSSELGRALIQRPWQGSMGFAKAVEETDVWLGRIADVVRPPPCRRGHGRYSRNNARKGYYVVILRTGAQLRDEGRVMDHCVGSYDRRVANGECIVVSIRRGPQRLATMEIVRRNSDARAAYGIAQLQGRANTRPPPAVERVAQEWVVKHGREPLSAGGAIDETAVDPKAWEHLWRPYLVRSSALGRVDPSLELSQLVCDVEQLAIYA